MGAFLRAPVWVKVAAVDSPAAAKSAAGFVCPGEHDKATLQRAIDLGKLFVCTDLAKRLWTDAMGVPTP